METFKCFFAMLLAVLFIVTLSFIGDSFIQFIQKWKDVIDVVAKCVAIISVVFAARQFYLSHKIRQVESIDRLLLSIRSLEKELNDNPKLRDHIMRSIDELACAELKDKGTRWCDEVTRHYRSAYMYYEMTIIREIEMNSIKESAKSVFRSPVYLAYWQSNKKHYKERYYQFYNFMERRRREV